MLPQIAQGSANKLWIVPAELGKALEGIGNALGGRPGEGSPSPDGGPHPAVPVARPAVDD
jgi:hypothetical protein